MDVIAEPANKFAVLQYSTVLSEIHNEQRSGVSSIKILGEKVDTFFLTFKFIAFNPFVDYINQIMDELAAGGFLSYWRKLEMNPKGFKTKIDDIGPQVLTMEHLEIGFVICLYLYAICEIIFVFEIVFNRENVSKISKLLICKVVDLLTICVKKIEQLKIQIKLANQSDEKFDKNFSSSRLNGTKQRKNVESTNEQFEFQTIKNDESTTETNDHLAESRLSLSNLTEAKLDKLSDYSSIFEIESLKSPKQIHEERNSVDPTENNLSLFGDLVIHLDSTI